MTTYFNAERVEDLRPEERKAMNEYLAQKGEREIKGLIQKGSVQYIDRDPHPEYGDWC